MGKKSKAIEEKIRAKRLKRSHSPTHEQPYCNQGDTFQWLGSNVVVSLRRKLQASDDAARFCASLHAFLRDHPHCTFKDFDVSENHIPNATFAHIMHSISHFGAWVQRLRLFGTSSFDDDSCAHLGNWLRHVNAKTLPLELHLSNCGITDLGLSRILDALGANPAFPRTCNGKQLPLYIRLENNYIKDGALVAAINAGIVSAFMKSAATDVPQGKAKCAIKVDADGKFHQKNGSPPQKSNHEKDLSIASLNSTTSPMRNEDRSAHMSSTPYGYRPHVPPPGWGPGLRAPLGYGPPRGLPAPLGYGVAPLPRGLPVEFGYGAAPPPRGLPVEFGYGAAPPPRGLPVEFGYGAAPPPLGHPMAHRPAWPPQHQGYHWPPHSWPPPHGQMHGPPALPPRQVSLGPPPAAPPPPQDTLGPPPAAPPLAPPATAPPPGTPAAAPPPPLVEPAEAPGSRPGHSSRNRPRPSSSLASDKCVVDVLDKVRKTMLTFEASLEREGDSEKHDVNQSDDLRRDGYSRRDEDDGDLHADQGDAFEQVAVEDSKQDEEGREPSIDSRCIGKGKSGHDEALGDVSEDDSDLCYDDYVDDCEGAYIDADEETLPEDWEKLWDEDQQAHYYWNSCTGDTTWDFPQMT